MNVFEDLIEELKEENLLEDTVMDVSGSESADSFFAVEPPPFTTSPDAFDDDGEILFEAEEAEPENEESLITESSSAPVAGSAPADVPSIVKPGNLREFFRKRAMEEVSSMQMVEHVLSGVEREHMKIVPVPYDDLEAKKALHRFLQASDDPRSQECSDAEYELLQETQKWYGVLADRDSNISVANIRRFCENSRPVLSSQALISLARFYRNSPFSEPVRGKFDFIMTKLFSREAEENKRRLLFARADMVGHIKTLYENWSSINLFSFEEHETEFTSAVKQFEEFAAEAEAAEDLDKMLATEIFDRLRVFKEGLAEMFFAQEVVAAAIDCNLRIGNRFVDLVEAARESGAPEVIEQKYGSSLDQVVSGTMGKTLELVDLLRAGEDYEEYEEAAPRTRAASQAKAAEPEKASWLSLDIFGVNKWLLAATILVCIASVGVYFGADKFGGETSAISAKSVDVANPELQQHLSTVRSTTETLYAVTQPSWESLSEDERRLFLSKLNDLAKQRGLKRVNLLNGKGRTIGFADETRVELIGSL